MKIFRRNQASIGKKSSFGFSMIEVLVSVIIVAIGMLGLAGLSLASLRKTNDSNMRTIANALALDATERMRTTYANNATITPVQDPGKCATVSGCSQSAMQQNDYYSWQTMVRQQLPEGVGIICLDSSPDDGTTPSSNSIGISTDTATAACDGNGEIYAVKIWWFDRNALTSDHMQRMTITF